MSDNTTRALYDVVADFSNLRREARQARRELAQLKAAEKAYNDASRRNSQGAAQTAQARQRAVTGELTALRAVVNQYGRYTRAQTTATVAVRAANKAITSQNRLLLTNAERLAAAAESARKYSRAQKSVADNTTAVNAAMNQNNGRRRQGTVRFTEDAEKAADAAKHATREIEKIEPSSTRWGRAMQFMRRHTQSFRRDVDGTRPALRHLEGDVTRVHRGFVRFGNWRPRLTPPFVALIPIIAAVAAALNPLVALLGAVGIAAFGLVSNIGSLSGAFLALPGILSAVVGGIASVIASMGGVGNVFKTYAAMQKATGSSGGGGESAADRADRLADAEANLGKTQRAVQKAQENLNKARERALKDLIDLRKEVSRASVTEERAAADLQSAIDAYNNVMADPGSQRGDKMDAAVRIKEAEQELADVRERNLEAAKELNEAERKGIENSDRVLDAQEDLADAIRSQRDAQKALNKEYQGGNAAVQATNEYNEALKRLSPSAQTVVLALIAMKDTWQDMTKTVQESFFKNIAGDMGRLPSIIETIGNFLRPAADAMGRFAHNFLLLFDSPEWKRDLATIGQQNADVIDNLGGGFLKLVTFFKDLIIAAGPFTDWLTGAFEKGMSNLSELLDTDPEKKGLARWLETVRVRLEKWYDIIKNVVSTLFDYGAAASAFGDWISDGLLEMTENWAKAAEAARQPGSEFQTFLENIKPLLEEVDGLFGDFFGWFRDESMDPKNIEDATALVATIRDLGGSIGEFFDALAKTDIDEAIVEAVAAIVDSLTAMVEAGGSAGFEAFMDVIVGFFKSLAEFLGRLAPGQVSLLMSILGGLAGLAFIGKFTGITSFIGWLLRLNKAKFAALLGPTGLIAGFALLAGMSFAKQEDFNKSVTDFLGTPTNKNAGKALDAGSENGSFLKSLGTVPGTNLSASPVGPSAGQSLGFFTELLHGFDSIFGTQLGTEFENFLEDITTGLFDWAENDFAPWMSGVAGEWNNFWTDFNETMSTFFTDLDTNVRNWLGGIGDGWNKFWGEDVPKSWETFTTNFRAGWDNFWNPIIENWNLYWGEVRAGWDAFWGGIGKGWSTFSTNFRTGWDTFWGGVRTQVETTVNAIGAIWSGIQQRFKDPINWVIQYVYNNGLRKIWNAIAAPFGWTQLGEAPYIQASPPAGGGGGKAALKYARGGVLPGDNQGVDNHHFVDQNGMKLDLGGGEGILIPQAAKMLGGEKGVNQINNDARRQSFAKGGVFGGNGRGIGGNLWEVAGDVFDKFKDLFSNPLGWITQQLGNGVNGLLGGFAAGSDYNKLLSQIPGTVIKNLGTFGADKAKDARRKADDVGGAGGSSAMGWKNQWTALKAAFPSANLNSAYRAGSPGYHGKGRAIDVTPSIAIFDWIKKNYGATAREIIYTPAGGRQVQNGRNYNWPDPAIRAAHHNHVHWAMRRGGTIPKLYDQGGWLPHGGTAVNRSGKPEAVLTAAESQALKGLLSGNGLLASQNGLTTGNSVGSLRGAAQQVNDYSVNVGNVTITNPVPEKVSVSLPKAIRQIGYMQNARQTG